MVHGFTIFLSAGLVFLVQLILAKRLLPWFGGAPAVWTTCMLFFQVLLLAGYAYAHGVCAWFPPRRQAQVHALLIVVSLALVSVTGWQWGVPLLPVDALKPDPAAAPVIEILKLLGLSVGLPYLLLSATSPLIQRWHSLRRSVDTTYRLYALSNAGSMLGLLAYPFLVEPHLTLTAQAWGWTVLYALFAGGVLGCALQVRLESASAPPLAMQSDPPPQADRITILQQSLWLLLSAVTSSLMLAVTNILCQDMASVPFLWVMPLAIYLLTFILCFDHPRWYVRRGFVLAAVVTSCLVVVSIHRGVNLGYQAHLVSCGAFLFAMGMTCHGELARLKPAAQHLTRFYLAVALGGALGGLFVALGAPLWFRGFWEFHVALIVGWLVLGVVFLRDRTSWWWTGDRWAFYVLLFLTLGALIAGILLLELWPQAPFIARHKLGIALGAAGLLTSATGWRLGKSPLPGSRFWPVLLIAGVVLTAACFLQHRVDAAHRAAVSLSRNFYGALRVERVTASTGTNLTLRRLVHGQINHGIQFEQEPWSRRPVSYYSTNSGLGLAFRYHPRRLATNTAAPLHVGVIGLGTGTIAACGRRGDVIRFYEINPTVADYSLGTNFLFTYLFDSAATTDVVLGDARLSLEREWRKSGGRGYDLLVMDAFSSDSIPTHLLTREAFDLYVQHLRDTNAIIAVHISNRFLDLRDLVFSAATRLSLRAVVVESDGTSPEPTRSTWMLLSRNRAFAEHSEVRPRVADYKPRRYVVWTDQFSNLFEVLKPWR